ncbi:MAG: NAD(P)-dependent alcohol dehydrogenase [Nannocystaceae bacterium]
MKAIIYGAYGGPEQLSLADVEAPTPARGEVLVKVHATSINASDWEFLTGKPLYTRMWGLRRPKFSILGSDIAGRVAALGAGVEGLAVGDAVFGDILGRWGGLAELARAKASELTKKPDGLTFAQAACLPQAACVALQALRYDRPVAAGERVLITGAGGGSGSFAVQLARHFGAEVTGVDRGEKLEAMRSFGAAHVIDYTRADFRRMDARYDRIVDFVANRGLLANRRALAPGGVYVLVGGTWPKILSAMLVGPALSRAGRRRVGMLMAKANAGIDELLELVAAGHITPRLDRCFPLAQAADALRYLGEGRSRGKVVVTVADD